MDTGTTEVGGQEWLARFILRPEFVRHDGTLKPDPFIPFKHVELSVTRHAGCDAGTIWGFAKLVGTAQSRPVIGRGDTQATTYRRVRLDVLSAPVPDNPHHANVVGWPTDKPSQKAIALEIARAAVFVSCPA